MQDTQLSEYKDSDRSAATEAQTETEATDGSIVRSSLRECSECESQITIENREVICTTCGLVIEERFVNLAPRFQLRNVKKDEDKRGMETATPYLLDQNGSPYQDAPLGVTFPVQRSDWRFDGRDRRVPEKTYNKWDDIRFRQVKFTSDSRDNWRTDALQDIKCMGHSTGLPRHVCKRATAFFRRALDEELAGGRMAYESLAIGALVVAAREADCYQGIDELAQWARTPHERACAGARKIRLGLDLVEVTPPTRPGVAVEIVSRLAEAGCYDTFDHDLMELKELTTTLMHVADRERIGPGTSRATVAGAAAHRAGTLLSGGGGTSHCAASIPDVVPVVSDIVESSQSRIERYSRRVRDAYEK